jgi:hypothetical protein
MSLTNLKSFPQASSKFGSRINHFKKLLDELAQRNLPDHIITFINTQVAAINELKGSDKRDGRIVLKCQQNILRKLEKELKIVPKNYYRNLWMALGMSAFGIPMGVALGASLGNMAFIGVGIPIGMAIGMGVGSGMDQKAEKEGRQLDYTVNP